MVGGCLGTAGFHFRVQKISRVCVDILILEYRANMW